MIKEMIGELNRAMAKDEININVVKNLCKQLSKLTGLEYEVLNRRVIYRANDGTLHDAYVNC